MQLEGDVSLFFFFLCSRPLHANSQKERAKQHLNTMKAKEERRGNNDGNDIMQKGTGVTC